MASAAVQNGNMAISKLYARAAERFHDQSLLNLFQKSSRGLAFFTAVCTGPGAFFNIFSACASMLSAIIVSLSDFFHRMQLSSVLFDVLAQAHYAYVIHSLSYITIQELKKWTPKILLESYSS